MSLLKKTYIVSSMTFISRILGFARDLILAHFFGASLYLDSFFVAFKIPNFMRRLFAEGAFSQAFIPLLADYKKNSDKDKFQEFIDTVFGNLAVILLCLTVVVVLFAPYVIRIFTPGFDTSGERFLLSAEMLKYTFPYLMFISLTAFASALLNSHNKFAIPAITPVLLNISLIAMSFIGHRYFAIPVLSLSVGVFIAGILQLIFCLFFVARIGVLPRPKINFAHLGVKRLLKLMIPALFGVSVAQLNLLLDTVFASFLRYGSISWLYYSDRLVNFPLGVFGVAISTVILPTLSLNAAGGEEDKYLQNLSWGIKMILLIALPASLVLYFLAIPILITLLAYGKFSVLDVYYTSLSLKAFALGIPAFMLIKVLASAFYAEQDLKTPVKIACVSLSLNSILCLLFIKPFAHMGLALASVIAASVNALLLLTILIKRKGMFIDDITKFLLVIMSAIFIMLLWCHFVNFDLSYWVAMGITQRIYNLAYNLIILALIYLLCILAFLNLN